MSQAGRSLNGGIDYVFNFLQFLDYVSNGNASFYVNSFGDVICNSINIAQSITVSTINALVSVIAPSFRNTANSFSASSAGDVVCRGLTMAGNLTMNTGTTLTSRNIINSSIIRSYKFENTTTPTPSFSVNALGDIICKSVTMTDDLVVNNVVFMNGLANNTSSPTFTVNNTGDIVCKSVAMTDDLIVNALVAPTIVNSSGTPSFSVNPSGSVTCNSLSSNVLQTLFPDSTGILRNVGTYLYNLVVAAPTYLTITAAAATYLTPTTADGTYCKIINYFDKTFILTWYFTKTDCDARYVQPSDLVTYVSTGYVLWNGSSYNILGLFNNFSLITDDGGVTGKSTIIIVQSASTIRNMIFATGMNTSTLSAPPVIQATPMGNTSGRATYVVETYNVGGSRVRASFQFMII
jgi:hypothetical protein